MKIASFNDYQVGVVDGQELFDMTSTLPDFLSQLPRQRINWLVQHWSSLKETFADYRRIGKAVALSSVKLLAANPAPQHLFAAPANWHAKNRICSTRPWPKLHNSYEKPRLLAGFFIDFFSPLAWLRLSRQVEVVPQRQLPLRCPKLGMVP